MIAIDAVLGMKAEFLNAWSVVQRLLGQAPTAGDSLVARTWGPVAEFLAVLAANAAAGALLTALARLLLGGR